MPKKVAFNGPMQRDAYKNGGYPLDDLVEVEALRYLHLSDTIVDAASATNSKNGPLRVLVLGDYLLDNTQLQMNLLVRSMPSLPADTVITVKPHPAFPINPADYHDLDITVTMEPITKLLTECDVAYSSAVTSAAVDAYCAGVPVVSVLDPNTLNLSPLRGCAGVLFASTPEDLAAALTSMAVAPHTRDDRHKFFTIDLELPRWRKLILNSLA